MINFKLSEPFIVKILKGVDNSQFREILCFTIRCQKVSEEFILKYLQFIDIDILIRHQSLSETFLNGIWDKIVEKGWVVDVLGHQKLPERFIMLHRSHFNWQWNLVLEYQEVSEAFIENLLEMNYITLRE